MNCIALGNIEISTRIEVKNLKKKFIYYIIDSNITMDYNGGRLD